MKDIFVFLQGVMTRRRHQSFRLPPLVVGLHADLFPRADAHRPLFSIIQVRPVAFDFGPHFVGDLDPVLTDNTQDQGLGCLKVGHFVHLAQKIALESDKRKT